MSYSVDVNVLPYASDQSSDRHARARSFVETCAASLWLLRAVAGTKLDNEMLAYTNFPDPWS